MKSFLMLTSLGLLLFGSAFTGQAHLVGKEVAPKDAARVIGGACGNQFKTGFIKCGGTSLCDGLNKLCSFDGHATLVPKASGSGLVEDPKLNYDCVVCSHGRKCGNTIQYVPGTTPTTCNGG